MTEQITTLDQGLTGGGGVVNFVLGIERLLAEAFHLTGGTALHTRRVLGDVAITTGSVLGSSGSGSGSSNSNRSNNANR